MRSFLDRLIWLWYAEIFAKGFRGETEIWKISFSPVPCAVLLALLVILVTL